MKIATTPEEKLKIYRFRYEIYRNNLNHIFLDKISEQGQLHDALDDGPNTVTIYSERNGKIIGNIRVSMWKQNELPTSIRKKYYIDDKILKNFKQFGEFRFIQVSPEYRHSYLGLVLMCNAVELMVSSTPYETLTFGDCQPGLINYYQHAGCFAYTDKVIFEEFSMLQIPLVYLTDLQCLKDRKAISYHLVKALRRRYPLNSDADKRPYQELIQPINLFATKDEIQQYREGLKTTKLKHRFDFIINILQKNIIVLKLPKDACVITNNIIDYDIYMLIEGKLGVYHDKQLIAILEPGAIFGEMAYFHHEHKRGNDVIAITPVKVILISRKLIHSLEKNNMKIANKLMRLLNESISEKLSARNAGTKIEVKHD